MCRSPVLYPGLHLNQRQDGFQYLAGRAWQHFQHLLLHDHFVHDCLEVAQRTDHLLLLLLQPTHLLQRENQLSQPKEHQLIHAEEYHGISQY